VQLRVPPEFFGSGRGPLVNAAPAVRLLTGFLMLLAVLLVPSLPVVGVAMVALAMVTMLVLTGLPAGHLTRVLALGLLFYAPLVSLLALPTLLPTARALLDAAFAGPEQAREAIAVLRYDPSIHRIGWILLKGVASLTVTLATVATVSAAEIRLAIGSLPLPTSTRLILIQIIQQTGMLLDETARVRNAVSLRSGSRGCARTRAGWCSARGLADASRRQGRSGCRGDGSSGIHERAAPVGHPPIRLARKRRRSDSGWPAPHRGIHHVESRPMNGVGTSGTDPRRLEAVRFSGVSARYSAASPQALSDCSFVIEPGARTALVGPNGSGKSTILLATVGLVAHDGEITVSGRRVERSSLQAVRDGVGFLFANPEDQILLPRVIDDVAFSLTSRGKPTDEAEAAARGALARLNAAELGDRSPFRMSQGQRLRAALAGALVSEPPLLLLDEPTSGLDRAGRELLAADLRSLSSAMLIATHDLDFARSCCTRYLRIENGRVVAGGDDLSGMEE
jgi:cobalt/nickel transport system ATP-binding protein